MLDNLGEKEHLEYPIENSIGRKYISDNRGGETQTAKRYRGGEEHGLDGAEGDLNEGKKGVVSSSNDNALGEEWT